MALFVVPQSLPLTIVFAVLSGTFLTLATAATNLPSYIDRMIEDEQELEKENLEATPASEELTRSEAFIEDMPHGEQQEEQIRHKISPRMWKIAYGVNLFFASIGGTLNLVGTWFGPISLFNPIKQTAQIISGMVVFSYILKTEPMPDKETSVGNYIIMISSIMLIFVGPKVNEELIDPIDLLTRETAIICAAILLGIGFIFSFPYQFVLGCSNIKMSDRFNFIALLITEIVHAVIGNSCSKLVPLFTGKLFAMNMVILVLAIFTITYSAILRSTVIVEQTKYLPLMLSGNIFLNGIVGLILWEDAIINIGAYILLYFFFIIGTYLVSDHEIMPGTFIDVDDTDIFENILNGRARSLYIEAHPHIHDNDSHSSLGEGGHSRHLEMLQEEELSTINEYKNDVEKCNASSSRSTLFESEQFEDISLTTVQKDEAEKEFKEENTSGSIESIFKRALSVISDSMGSSSERNENRNQSTNSSYASLKL